MRDFKVTLRLDTPLLLGGAVSGEPDPLHWVRGASVKGLLHTFTRALIGPAVGGSIAAVRPHEMRLLGEAAVKDSNPPTFRVESIPDTSLIPVEVCTLPHKHQGSRMGFATRQTVTLTFKPYPWVFDKWNDDLFRKTLWSVIWTAFSLGALGLRSRRGYGSLTIQAVEGLPEGNWGFPILADPPKTDVELACHLTTGLKSAQDAMNAWIGPSAPPIVDYNSDDLFFQVRADRVRVGSVTNGSYEPLMIDLMNACSDAKSKDRDAFYDGIGKSDRLASPLWVRFYEMRKGHYAPVFTYSPRTESADYLADGIRNALGAGCDPGKGIDRRITSLCGGGGTNV